jgi:hypothetical protein
MKAFLSPIRGIVEKWLFDDSRIQIQQPFPQQQKATHGENE